MGLRGGSEAGPGPAAPTDLGSERGRSATAVGKAWAGGAQRHGLAGHLH